MCVFNLKFKIYKSKILKRRCFREVNTCVNTTQEYLSCTVVFKTFPKPLPGFFAPFNLPAIGDVNKKKNNTSNFNKAGVNSIFS